MQTSETFMNIVACPRSQPGHFTQSQTLRHNRQSRNTPEPCSVRVNEWHGKRLGALAGAHAELTDGTRPHRVGAALVTAPLSLGAGLLIGLTRKSKASAFVVFADGTVHERKLDGKSAISAAQRDAVKFNALTNAAGVVSS